MYNVLIRLWSWLSGYNNIVNSLPFKHPSGQTIHSSLPPIGAIGTKIPPAEEAPGGPKRSKCIVFMNNLHNDWMNTSIVCFIDLDQLRPQNFKQNKPFLAICGSNQYVDRILRNFQAEFEQNHCLWNSPEWKWNFNYLVFYRAEFEQNKLLVEQNYEQNHNVQE